ncbi:protein serine threonine [Stylonychia lemnae]|uniref:Protein serine threonine n=1 Tax=Stylonychia lemnae TaxID=5949 RepID=A0A078B839_STYLE|nr:protein serine threonine [Stylonychia lemnae]|eukprot:CDW90564.1 protein serine threonine [Stylonychia lemnae]
MRKTQLFLVFLSAFLIIASAQLQKNMLGEYFQRNLQAAAGVCNTTQYQSGTLCKNCPIQCAGCVPPLGSCERCPAPTLTNRNISYLVGIPQSNLTTCMVNSMLCPISEDPFCLSQCIFDMNTTTSGTSTTPGTSPPSGSTGPPPTSTTTTLAPSCSNCIRGTMVQQFSDPITKITKQKCLPCPIDNCAHCGIDLKSQKPVCFECEKKYMMINDTTGQITCSRDQNLRCPAFCKCDNSLPPLCLGCNDTTFVLRKEVGLSVFNICAPANTTDQNIPCSPNCIQCNTQNGVCLKCREKFAPIYNPITFQYSCEMPCGEGCLNCNETTRSCLTCDTEKNFTAFFINSTTSRCFDKSKMCQPECTNCDTSNPQFISTASIGTCKECQKGTFLSNRTCLKCQDLCSSCNSATGSCLECKDPRNTLVTQKDGFSICTDRKCSSQCTTCDIQNGITTSGAPICLKCNDGFFVSSSTKDCTPCPLNCGVCDVNGTCSSCKTGFTLVQTTNQCVTGSTSGTCIVPYCETCNSISNSTCLQCKAGYNHNMNGSKCECGITLAYKGQRYTPDWSQIVVQWKGQIRANLTKAPDVTTPAKLCTFILAADSLTAIDQTNQQHQCYIKYDEQLTVFLLVLNSTFTPTSYTIGFQRTSLFSPSCESPLMASEFEKIALDKGDQIAPQIVIEMPTANIPLGTKNFKLNALRSAGLFGKKATFTWSVISFLPAETVKQTEFQTLIGSGLAEIQFSSTDIVKYMGKSIKMKLSVSNFLGLSNSTEFMINFLNYEGLIWRELPDSFVVNPTTDFALSPKMGITATTLTQDVIQKFTRLMIVCTLLWRNPNTTRFQVVYELTGCQLSSGIMKFGNEYIVNFLGYDPVGEYSQNITKNSTIQLVKPPLTAKIIGGDQTADPAKDIPLSIQGTNLAKELIYAWTCYDPQTGLNCKSKTSDQIILYGTESVLIKGGLLENGKSYKINFIVSDSTDVNRKAADSILLTTITAKQTQLVVKIGSEAEKSGNTINTYDKQLFILNIFDANNTRIQNISSFNKTWKITDSNDKDFVDYQTNADALQIMPLKLSANNIYQICVEVSPQNGVAFETLFTLSCQPTQTLSIQFEYEFGIVQLSVDPDKAIRQVFVPFETASQTQSKQYKINPPPEGQTSIRVYAKLTSQKGEKYFLFQEVKVTLPVLNATNVASEVKQANYDNLNEISTQSKKIDQVVANLDAKSQKAAAQGLLQGIANFTVQNTQTQNNKQKQTGSSYTQSSSPSSTSTTQSSSSSSSTSSSSTTTTSDQNTITIAQSLQTVTSLYKQNPEILTKEDKEQLRQVIKTMIGLDDSDSQYYASVGDEASASKNQSSTLKTQNSQGSKDQGSSVAPPKDSSSQSQNETKMVTKYDSTTAQAILKVCDDLLIAENKANQSDEALKKQAFVGIKKVLSGSLSGVDSTFSYSSENLNAQAIKFESGSSKAGNQTLQIKDPNSNSTEKLNISLPSGDVCKGETCSIHIITIKSSPNNASSQNQGEIIASTVSISFEQSSSVASDSSQIMVKKVKVSNLVEPIQIQMKFDITKVQNGTKQRCVYIDTVLGQMSDAGVITSIDNVTGAVNCSAYHLTDFSIESYDPEVAAKNRMSSNIYKIKKFSAIEVDQSFPVIGIILIGVKLDKSDEKLKNKSKKLLRLKDILYFNSYQEGQQIFKEQIKRLEESKRDLKQSFDESQDADSKDNNLARSKFDPDHLIQLKKQLKTSDIIQLSLKNQHRLTQIINFYDQDIPRCVKALILGVTLFIHLCIGGLYSASDDVSIGQAINAAIISLAIQKILLLLFRVLIKKADRSEKAKRYIDENIENEETEPDQDKVNQNKVSNLKPLNPDKRSDGEKLSLTLAVIIAILLIGGCIFMSLMIAGSLDESDNMQWTINFVLAIIIDLLILESILVAIGGFFTSLVGKDPIALGGMRNLILALGPKAIRQVFVPQKQQQAQQKQAYQQQ